ncbi:hypothetical protein [Pseudomonas sp. dw_358]|uniref:hypothetical protein n=1 Tax=Pseudomonas sp. dw_358 TaxID=2720083 RepID=UPI001BD4EA7B|nr:hypothetical protein [Pseudomonas sp. dw_358]
MNRQGLVHAAQAAVTPQQVQQGLFLMLAMVVTLLMCQQYSRWVEAHAPEPVAIHSMHSTHISPVLAKVDQAPAFQQVERVAEAGDQPQQPRWVF